MTPPRGRRLAERIPVFPLAGALLLPRAELPLNIFEPRYLAMVRDAMAGLQLIGMVQPKDAHEPPALFSTGGLGRITQFSESSDGRLLITLTGLTRFRIGRELEVDTPYRQVAADYAGFAGDLREPDPLPATARADLEASLKSYLDAQGLSADWDAVAGADDESLVNTLCAACPFSVAEKQALLEAADVPARADVLTALMTFAQPTDGGEATLH